MRSVIFAACGGVAVVLQGCGGGGGGEPVTKDCTNKALNLVSQSSNGAVTASVVGSVPKAGKSDVSATMTTVQKIDFEKFNLRMDITKGTITAKAPAAMSIDVAVKLIFNAGTKEVVAQYDIGAPLNLKNCTKITSPKIPTPAAIEKIFKSVIMPVLQSTSKCGGNDGTSDIWKIDFDSANPTPGMPPIPLPAGDSVELHSEMRMDKDFLMHKVSEKISYQITQPPADDKMTGDVSIVVDVSNAAAGGPAVSDMDYSKWGTCYNQPVPPGNGGIRTVFQPADQTPETALLDKILLEGAIQKIFLASMNANPEAAQAKAVVV